MLIVTAHKAHYTLFLAPSLITGHEGQVRELGVQVCEGRQRTLTKRTQDVHRSRLSDRIHGIEWLGTAA